MEWSWPAAVRDGLRVDGRPPTVFVTICVEQMICVEHSANHDTLYLSAGFHIWTYPGLHLAVTMAPRRRTLTRFLFALALAFLLRLLFFPSSNIDNATTHHLDRSRSHHIKQHNIMQRATRPDRSLNVQKHRFLQARMGRDEPREIMADAVTDGMWDWWERFQIP